MSNPQVTISRLEYIVRLNGTTHRILRNGSCSCGGTPQWQCPAIPLIQRYLAVGGQRPPGCDESDWPETWTTIPARCPICGCPTISDPCLNSRAGPGWKCSLTNYEHFWLVRTNPLRRYLAKNPPTSSYPWRGMSHGER